MTSEEKREIEEWHKQEVRIQEFFQGSLGQEGSSLLLQGRDQVLLPLGRCPALTRLPEVRRGFPEDRQRPHLRGMHDGGVGVHDNVSKELLGEEHDCSRPAKEAHQGQSKRIRRQVFGVAFQEGQRLHSARLYYRRRI